MQVDVQLLGIISAAIIGLVEVAKRTGLASKWAALLAVGLGVAAGFLWLSPGDWRAALLGGIIAGLTAAGLWSGSRATTEAVKGNG